MTSSGSLAIGLLMTNIAYVGTEIKTYPKESCQEIYKAIGTFLRLADETARECESNKRDVVKTEYKLKD